ncbi:MAG TPA: helix-turn-helix domain-containing protein [Bradyrhizobium sp.]|nr:helix-turn-helix domain-containing protein [Bradyrhizobium sp.]
MGLRSARERIAHLLLELYIRLRGRTPNKGDVIRIPLTQGHIGQAVGLTGVHVSRTLRTLREQGIAQFVKQDLEILDPNALVRTAGFPDLVPETTLTLDRLHAPNSERFAALSEAATLAYQ